MNWLFKQAGTLSDTVRDAVDAARAEAADQRAEATHGNSAAQEELGSLMGPLKDLVGGLTEDSPLGGLLDLFAAQQEDGPATGPAGPAVDPTLDPAAADAVVDEVERADLSGPVGEGAANAAEDVAWVRERLEAAGLEVGPGDAGVTEAVKDFQERAFNKKRAKCDGVVDVGGQTHHALAAGARPRPVTDHDPDALVEGSSLPEVVALRQAVDAARTLRDGIDVNQGEEAGSKDGKDAEKRDALVEALRGLRAQVKGLALPGLDPEEARAIRAWGFRRINELSPYYSQGRNANFLETAGATRTCNVTSIAMALEAMSKSASDYTGSMATLDVFRSHGGNAKGDYDYEEAFDKAWGENGTDLTGLRLPDFLQLVVAAKNLKAGKDGVKESDILAAVKKSWDDILKPNSLRHVATLFGAKAWVRSGVGGSGSAKERWLETYGAELDAGNQVVLLTPGHFVRLQSVTDEGLIVDDPATGTKKNRPIPFSDARALSAVVLA